MPGLQEAYYGELEVEELGLVEARCETYAGLIFACWDEEAPDLEAYLGDARWYLDLRFNRRDCGMQAIGPQKWIEPSNWKMSVDNSSDNYHVTVSHFSSSLVLFRRHPARRAGTGGPGNAKALYESPARHLSVNGHSLTAQVVEEGAPRYNRAVTPELIPIIDEFYKRTLPEAEKRLGSFRARRLRLGNHSLFPHTVLGLRLAHPRGPYNTEFWSFQTYEADAPKEYVKSLQLDHDQQNGISGMFEQDDQDNWIQVTQAGRSPRARKHLSYIPMGLGHAGPSDQFPGDRGGEVHLGEQPAAVLCALAGVHERRELEGHSHRPHHRHLRRDRNLQRLGSSGRTASRRRESWAFRSWATWALGSATCRPGKSSPRKSWGWR